MAKPEEVVLSGSCMCGAVTYTSTTLPTDMGHCHCLTCRKLSGAPFCSFADFPTSSITWTSQGGAASSALKKMRYSDVAERTHCTECGSPITMIYDHQPQITAIAAGTIDEASVKGELRKADHHTFLGKKAGWYDLPDDETGREEKFSPSFQDALEAGGKK